MKLKNIYYLLFAGALLLIPKFAFAVPVEGGVEVNGVTDYVSYLFSTFILPIVGGLALLMVIYAGYLYMTSQGNPDSINQAKDILIGVITGIVLLFLIRVILNQIGV
jgi:hypothetical protein